MNKVYVVTGASSGIGYALVEKLASMGRQVVAGVRTEEDRQRVAALGKNVHVCFLDVTNDEQISSAFAMVQKLTNEPIVLVNNAGVATGTSFELEALEQTRAVFEVNYFGVLKMIKAFLPLLKGGRVVNVGSLAGVVAMPYMSAYAASKFALEGASDALRRELEPMGIKVVLVQPGIISTPIWKKGLKVLDERAPTVDSPYYKKLKTFYRLIELSDKYASPVSYATKALMQAVDAPCPRARYAAGQGAGLQMSLYRMLPTSMFDAFIRFLYKKLESK